MDYTDDERKIDALFTRTSKRSPQYNQRQHRENRSELTPEQVSVFLKYSINKSIDAAEAMEKTLKKQMILERRNMFDPARYFGQPRIDSLDDALDRRIDQIFDRSHNQRGEPSNVATLKQKQSMIGVSNELKKKLSKNQKLCLGSLQKIASCIELENQAKIQKTKLIPTQIIMKIRQNKQNSRPKINYAASNMLSPKKINRQTPLQKVRLKLKSSSKQHR